MAWSSSSVSGRREVEAVEDVLVVEHALVDLVIGQAVERAVHRGGNLPLLGQKGRKILRKSPQRTQRRISLHILRLADDEIRRLTGGDFAHSACR